MAALLARVVAALEDGERAQRRIVEAQARDDRGAQGVFAMIQRQAQFGEADHRRRAACGAATDQWNASMRVAPISGSSSGSGRSGP